MNSILTTELKEVIQAVHYRPAVSIVMPFEPKMDSKTALAYALKAAVHKVEQELLLNYPDEICTLVMHKINAIIKGINFNTYKKSVAIYVSPVFEKILYLDIAVEEKIIIDESFEIRDLVYSKKQFHKYLVLLLSGSGSQIYLADSNTFVKIVSAPSPSVHAGINDIPQRVANFFDKSERKEIMMHKFLHHIDNTVDIVLNAYHLPLFVMGTERIVGHFKKLTKHAAAVIEYVQGNYEDATLPMLKQILEPYITDWKKVREKDLMNQLEEAAGKKQVAIGMKEVWKDATKAIGRLLLVEKNYMYAAEHGSIDEVIYKATEPYNKFSYIKDAVDDVMEKVLESGGDVEFVEPGMLKDYQHIALIQYY